MNLRKQISEIYENVFEDKNVLFKVLPNGVTVREKELFIDNNGKPFQFDNRFDIITYAKANDWNRVGDDYGNVSVEFAFAYNSSTKLIDEFIQEARMNGVIIESINNNTAEILQRYFFRNPNDDKYPINYKGILVITTFTNIQIKNFLCENC